MAACEQAVRGVETMSFSYIVPETAGVNVDTTATAVVAARESVSHGTCAAIGAVIAVTGSESLESGGWALEVGARGGTATAIVAEWSAASAYRCATAGSSVVGVAATAACANRRGRGDSGRDPVAVSGSDGV